MTPRKQTPLPLDNRQDTSLDVMKNVLGKVRTAVTELAKVVETDPERADSPRARLVAAFRDLNVRLETWIRHLDDEQAEHVRRREAALERRREHLARSAKTADWVVKRRKHYDFVDCFRVDYKKERVTISLGSEKLETSEEVNGEQLFSHLFAIRKELDEFPFDRLDFFQTLKDAIRLAVTLGRDRDGRVPIRDLYPLVTLVRQGRNERFLKKPDSKSFAEYPMAQFAYDLARFEHGGSTTGRGERLSNQPPNMADIASRKAVTLPVLGGRGGDGVQLGSIWIERERL